jgi:hypothetical protein
MAARRTFVDLERLGRERGYGVSRRGRAVRWWRVLEPSRVYESSGVGDAWDDIILDCSSEKPVSVGTSTTRGERT